MLKRRLRQLPESDDEIFEGAERYISEPKDIGICSDHTKDNWFNHKGYNDNGDGTISCRVCPWGCRMSGRYRIVDGNVVDLKDLSS